MRSLTAFAERPVEQRLSLRPRLAQSCAARSEQATSKSMAQCLVVECVTLLKVASSYARKLVSLSRGKCACCSCTLEN